MNVPISDIVKIIIDKTKDNKTKDIDLGKDGEEIVILGEKYEIHSD
jgi:hypothetical protein